MANKPIKSIKYPGLSDTYTFLQSDSSLTQSGQAADAKVTGDEIADLKSALDFAISDIEEEVFVTESLTLTNGKLIQSDGTIITTSTSYGVSNVVDVTGYKFLYISGSAGYGNMIYAFYDSSDNFISGKVGSSDGNILRITDELTYIPYGATSLVIAYTMQSHASLKGVIGYKAITDSTFTESDVPADSKAVGKLKNIIESIATEKVSTESLTLTNGKLILSNGTISTVSTSYGVSNIVDVTDYKYLYISGSAAYGNLIYAFYDENDTFVGGKAGSSDGSVLRIIDELTYIPDDAVSLAIAYTAQSHAGLKGVTGYKTITDSTLTEPNTPANAKVVGDKFALKVNQPLRNGEISHGTDGQFLKTNGDGTTEWRNVDVIDPEIIGSAVENYIAENPETIAKEYITPEMYGAVGDGVTDDTSAVQDAFDTGKTVLLSKTYLVSETIVIKSSCKRINGSKIITSLNLNPVVSIAPDPLNVGFQMKHSEIDVLVDCSGAAALGILFGKVKQSLINAFVINAGATGIDTGSSSAFNENTINFGVQGNSSGTTQTGVKIGNSDTYYTNISVYDCLHGIELYSYGALYASCVHCWLSTTLISAMWDNSSAIYLNASTAMVVSIDMFYQDNIKCGILASDRMVANINYFAENESYKPSGKTSVQFKCTSPENPSKISYKTYFGASCYPIFDGMINSSVYGGNDAIHTYSNNPVPEFTDIDDAPTMGFWYLPSTTSNLPSATASYGKSECFGELVVQTVYVGVECDYIYTRSRLLGTDSWSQWKLIA